jgi:GT2 family glycosyltransferase
LKNVKNVNNLKVYSLEKANIAAAINAGVNKAKYPNVVIMDSDCTVNKDTFRPMAKALDSYSVVRGAVIFKGTTSFSKLSAKLRTHVYEKENNLFFAPNIGFQRNVFNKVGNFNEFPNNRGHTFDSEWGYRASKLGIKLKHERKSIISHYCHTNPTSEIKVALNYGKGRAYCYRKGLLRKKTTNNFFRTMAIPAAFDKNETLFYNIFVALYVMFWNLGFLIEIVLNKLP